MSNFIFADPREKVELPDKVLTSHRQESWTYEILDRTDQVVGPLVGVKLGSGSLTYNTHAEVKSGGSLTYYGEEIDWDIHRIKITYKASTTYGEVEWPLGVFIVTKPEDNYSSTSRSQNLQLMDKTQILVEDAVASTYVIPAKTKVTDAIRKLVLSTGESRIILEDSNEVTRVTQVWKAGTTKLRIINDLLEQINFFSIFTDTEGNFRGSKYVKPESRPAAWSFVTGENSIFKSEYTRTDDRYGRPNRCIVLASSDGTDDGIKGVAVDQADYNKVKRWITRVEEGVEAATAAIAKEIAEKKLDAARSTSRNIELHHAALPPMLNARTPFHTLHMAGDGVVQTMDIPLVAGGMTKTSLRELKNERIGRALNIRTGSGS